jgi:hypothetical protein
MISAFDQTRIQPDDVKYATIINHMGILQQLTIQQGDKNAVATQQRTMQHTLRDDWGTHVTSMLMMARFMTWNPGCHRTNII